MTQTYIASDRDTVDFITWRYYGTQGGKVLEQVLEANPGLSDLGPELPAGTEVLLPDIDTNGQRTGTKLWD